MSPQAGSGEGFIVTLGFKSFAQLIVGEASSLGQAIDAFIDLKINPPVADK